MKLGRDKYQLELHWNTVLYSKEGVAVLMDAYFSGPALKISQQLNEKDELNIDMTGQYKVFVPNFYIAKVKWEGITYKDDKVYFDKMTIENKYLNSIPKLKRTDYFVIDTAKHEEKTHAFFMNYDCYLLNEDGELYEF